MSTPSPLIAKRCVLPSLTVFCQAIALSTLTGQVLANSDLPELYKTNKATVNKKSLAGAYHYQKKSVKVADLTQAFKNRIEIKFSQASHIRLKQGVLSTDNAQAQADIDKLTQLLATTQRYALVRMHDVSDDALDALKAQGEANTGTALPDLKTWFFIVVDVSSEQALALLINQLNELSIVDYATSSKLPAPAPGMDAAEAAAFKLYWQQYDTVPWPAASQERDKVLPVTSPNLPNTAKPPAPHSRITPPAPSDYVALQDYRETAPIGIDMDYVNGLYYGAAGWNWAYSDVEFSWNTSHQDLTKLAGNVYVNGAPSASAQVWRDHGTAVIGIISSDDNGSGTTGLVQYADVRLATHSPDSGYNPAAAISAAANQFWAGAVILLEMQTYASFDCNGSDSGDSLVPIEFEASAKDAIKTATASGRIVVQAAGNGNCDLDLAGFNSLFNPDDASQDSGAIIVGAGEKLTRNKAYFSTHGSRVDTHAEGDFQIYTTGYGDLYSADGENSWYTSSFSGTSGASPIVTSAAISLSSLLWEYHGSYWDPKEMRAVLRREGTPQQGGGHIGPRPDLRKHVESMVNRHLQLQSADFDGDGRTDYAVFRPASGRWYIRYATGKTEKIRWGKKGDIPAPADVTGDSRAELIVFRPSNGTWYIYSWDPLKAFRPIAWGQNGDLPVPLDYNGDGKAELAVYRRRADEQSYSHWYIRYSSKASEDIIWGEVSDTPIARDMDGDGRDDLLVFRGTTGEWWLRYSATGASQTISWGQWGDIPLTYKDKQSRWNIAVWRPSNATFYAKNITTGGSNAVQWGEPGDVPRFGDTNGNGQDEYIVWRPSTGLWWNLTTGKTVHWGIPGDLVMAK